MKIFQKNLKKSKKIHKSQKTLKNLKICFQGTKKINKKLKKKKIIKRNLKTHQIMPKKSLNKFKKKNWKILKNIIFKQKQKLKLFWMLGIRDLTRTLPFRPSWEKYLEKSQEIIYLLINFFALKKCYSLSFANWGD